MKSLYTIWSDRIQFAEIEVRQAHPGPGVERHTDMAQKFRDAHAFVREHQVPWPLLIDDLDGTVHQQYGALPDPAFLVDTDGRIAFIDYWTHVPTLHRAIERLMTAGGRGIVGESRAMRPLATITDGWPAIRRGLPQSFIDLETAGPGMASGVWLGYQFRDLLAPLARRATPLPGRQRIVLAAAAVAVGLTAFAAVRSRA